MNRVDAAAVPDLILRNCRLLNVYSGETYPTDISIRAGRISSISPCTSYDAETVLDCAGLLATPGLIDPHMHVDTTFLWPNELARVLVPLGTTTVFVDTVNIAHVGGAPAVRGLMEAFEGLPLRGYFSAPSYCPLDPRLETAAADLGSREICGLVDDGCVSIGETVWSKIDLGDADFVKRIAFCTENGKRVSGHGGEVRRGDEAAFDAYVTAGIRDDHCLVAGEDILPRLRRGLELFLVEASGRRGQLERLLSCFAAQGMPLDTSCLCVDNITVMDMVENGYGYLDCLVRIALRADALRAGLSPEQVFRMGSLYPAEYYRLSDRIGAVAPGRYADILLMSGPDAFPPEKVLVGGRIVAENGRLTVPLPQPKQPEAYRDTVDLGEFRAEKLDVVVPPGGDRARCHVIEVSDGDAANRDLVEELPVVNGRVLPDPERDILKIAVVERYGRNGNVGTAFVRGFGLRRGALATSVSVPSNNIVAVGVSDEEIRAALAFLREMGGGFVAVENGELRGSVSFPFGGIMSAEPYEKLVADLGRAQDAARGLGSKLVHPLFTMAQTVLSTLPDLGLTDRGLVDSRRGEILPVVLDT